MKKGDRISLIHCADTHAKMTEGMTGTVSLVDSLGTVHVDWDNGRKLGLVPGEDFWEKIEETS